MIEEVPLGAEEMLHTMGLAQTTVPRVLYGNRVPLENKQSDFEEIEYFLFKHYLVEEVPLPDERETPGGWAYLQISQLGYDLVQSGATIEQLLEADTLQKKQNWISCLEWQEEERLKREGPFWWKSRYGILFSDSFDPKYEQPFLWAVYRLNRKFALRHTGKEFPKYWVESILDSYFINTNFGVRSILLLLIAAGLIYVYL